MSIGKWIIIGVGLLVAAAAWACASSSGGTVVYTTYQEVDAQATGGDWEEVAAGRHVRCTIDDVESGDLGSSTYDQRVPGGRWTKIENDRAGRCGDDFETLSWRLGNCEREARNLAPLSCDLRLVWAARAHSLDMVKRGYFDHFNPEGESPFDRMQKRGMDFQMAAENLAFAPTLGISHLGWMTSPGHRKNILNGDFTHGGVGVVRTDEGYMLTELFMTP